VFAVRDPTGERELAGLPQLALGGLPDDDARALLATVIPGRLDERVRDLIVAETRGNPLAILELPRGLAATQLPGVGAQELPGRIEESFLRQLAALPDEARRAGGWWRRRSRSVTRCWSGARPSGSASGAWPARSWRNGLTVGERVTFLHPLVRSAVYRSAPAQERRLVHLAASRRRPIVRSIPTAARGISRRRRRGRTRRSPPSSSARPAARRRAAGLPRRPRILQRSVTLTRDPARRADRALAAAQANLHAGAFDAALGLLAAAEACSLDELQRARAELLRGQVAFCVQRRSDAPPLLLKAAERLVRLDPGLARRDVPRRVGSGAVRGAAGERRRSARGLAGRRLGSAAGAPPGASDLLLDGLAQLMNEGRAAAAPALRRATSAFAESPAEQNFRWGWMTTVPSKRALGRRSWHAINARQLRAAATRARSPGLPIDLTASAILLAWRGDLPGGGPRPSRRPMRSPRATGTRIAPFGAMLLAALSGARSRGHRADRGDGRERHPPGARASASSTRNGSPRSCSTGSGATKRRSPRPGRRARRRRRCSSPPGRCPS